jgi:hypothetical protein
MSVASLSYDAKKLFPGQMVDTESDKSSKLYITSRPLFGPDATSALHDSDKPQSTTIPSLVDAEIMQYHREPELILTDDSFYCEQSLHRLLSSSASIKRRWLQRVQEIKRKKANLNKTQPQITKFFCKVSRSQQPHQFHNGRPPDGISNDTTSRPQTRATTVQRLMTMFLHKRASNPPSHPTISPPPSHESHVQCSTVIIVTK